MTKIGERIKEEDEQREVKREWKKEKRIGKNRMNIDQRPGWVAKRIVRWEGTERKRKAQKARNNRGKR